jgi:hypothetical protein
LAPAHCNTMVETRTTSSPTTTSSIPFCHLWETCLPCALQSGESKPPFPHTHRYIYTHYYTLYTHNICIPFHDIPWHHMKPPFFLGPIHWSVMPQRQRCSTRPGGSFGCS